MSKEILKTEQTQEKLQAVEIEVVKQRSILKLLDFLNESSYNYDFVNGKGHFFRLRLKIAGQEMNEYATIDFHFLFAAAEGEYQFLNKFKNYLLSILTIIDTELLRWKA